MNYKILLSILLLAATATTHAVQSKFKMEQLSATQSRLEIQCQLAPDEVLLSNSIQFSTNMPSVRITKWFALKDPHTFFDPRSKKTEPVYSESVAFVLMIESPQEIPAHTIIHMHYSTNLVKQPQEKYFSLNSVHEAPAEEPAAAGPTLPQPPAKNHQKSTFTQTFTRITNAVTSWIQDKELPLILKFLLAFIIGLMMSLTPCIYPMIPITMGILHANKAPSLLRGFLLASAYTAGLSMTFAILGMIAAFGGAHFGSIMNNPLFIVPIILIFAYLGFSMLGFYDMYIPRFMQPRQGHNNNGSFVSAFTFGMINGTVASPCLSPGLALILGIVSGLANPALGFLLLFVFGVGSSFPLLIIGTFSTSLHILPRAGMWMIEFKKVFGFLLLGMCLYYVKTFMPEWIFYILLGTYIMIVALYYLYYGITHKSWLAKLTGVFLCLACAYSLTESYRVIFRATMHHQSQEKLSWRNGGYEMLRKQAQEQNKLLLLDFTADWCSLCKKLEKQFFSEPIIVQELPKRVIPVKIDCTTDENADSVSLRKKFTIIGFPTILLINPHTQTVIQKWSADLNDKDPQEFIDQLDIISK